MVSTLTIRFQATRNQLRITTQPKTTIELGKWRSQLLGPQSDNQSKRANTFGDVVSNDFNLSIVDRDNDINITQLGNIDVYLMDELDNNLETSPPVAPTFRNYLLRDDSIRFICADETSANWL